jgi:hypothetical protein
LTREDRFRLEISREKERRYGADDSDAWIMFWAMIVVAVALAGLILAAAHY